MRWPLAIVGMALLVSGCRSSSSELVEQELAAREDDVRQLEEELDSSSAYVHALEHELRASRGGAPHQPLLNNSPIQKISLGRLTSGLDTTPGDGDDALQVLLVPEDPMGHAVKVPGSASILAYEVTPEGTKILLSTWQVNPEQLASSWRNGLLSTGYSLILPFKSLPSSSKLRVVVRLKVADGRLFEADKDVTIRVPSYRKHRMPRADEPLPATMEPPIVVDPTPPAPELPPPTEVLPVNPRPVGPPDVPTPKPKADPVPPIPAIILQPEAGQRITVATSEAPEPIAQSKTGPSKQDR